MCRLFGLAATPRRVTATFWLIDAPDSLAVQSRREPDGVGLGLFEPDDTALMSLRFKLKRFLTPCLKLGLTSIHQR